MARTLGAASAKTGSAISIVLFPRLPKGEAIEDAARRTFSERRLDAPGPAQVLLAVAKYERRAAIETGLGAAGIVPEIDARQITRRLVARLESGRIHRGLEEAIEGVAVSVEATRDRRRPSPPDPLDEPPPEPAAAPLPTLQTALPDVPLDSGDVNTEGKPAPTPHRGRSLVPTAAMLSTLVVLGLALRRRRRASLEQAAPKPLRGPGRPVR